MPDSPTLLDLFAEDIGHASQLLQLVDEEFQALERRELPVLQQLLGAKQPLMQQLERNGRARAEILREAGVSLDREGLARYARERADGAELLARGDELGELLERCQQANLRNGRILSLIHISEPTRQAEISYAVFCLKKKKKKTKT